MPPSDTSLNSDDESHTHLKQGFDPLSDPLLSIEQRNLSNDESGSSMQNMLQTLALNENPKQELSRALYAFEVSVMEPFRVGEALSSHISYKIKTKTTSPEYRNAEFIVVRRFRDFLWLYNQLLGKYPGAIVPPIPEKHAIGRFQEEFIEARREALERFIRKVVAHPLFQPDADVRLFLESETFDTDKKTDRKGGFIGAFMEVTPQVNQPFPRVPDNDMTLEARRIQTENLEVQLKSLSKAFELLMKQRRDLGAALLEMGDTLVSLSTFEQNQPLSAKLNRLGNIHKTIRDLQEKQAKEDLNHILLTVEEHIRIIGSVKVAYASRIKAFTSLSAAEATQAKRADALTKLESVGKVRADKVAQAKAELRDAESQVQEMKSGFAEMTALLLSELERIDREKTVDFADAMKRFLAGMVETQRLIIAAWQSFYEEPHDAE
eukprot:jgi/Hompol1/6157/HPOL_002194-RA